jgi:hypothetical protein
VDGSSDEKRDTERFKILGQLQGEVMVFQPMVVREVSRTGAQIESAFPLQLNSLHDFRLTLGARSIVLKGRVVHCSISDVDQEVVVYRSGVEFIEPSDRTMTVITDFLEVLRGGRLTTGSSAP